MSESDFYRGQSDSHMARVDEVSAKLGQYAPSHSIIQHLDRDKITALGQHHTAPRQQRVELGQHHTALRQQRKASG
jgi:hypothetical protein